MPARVRDAIVIGILLVAAVAARLAWHRVGPWASLGIVFAAAVAAIVVYRRPGAHRPAPPAETTTPVQHQPLLLRRD
jgi:hypothetical protein